MVLNERFISAFSAKLQEVFWNPKPFFPKKVLAAGGKGKASVARAGIGVFDNFNDTARSESVGSERYEVLGIFKR